MTTAESLDSLIRETLADPSGAVSWMLQQLAGPALDDDLAEALTGRLVGAFTGGGPTDEAAVERNMVLAAALGACDCWGELAHCETCQEAGTSGWRSRDQAAFDLYIAPALRAFERPAPPEEPQTEEGKRP
ncbi:hypothetical protein OG418_00365 [Streptomyces phaeochromogenes]|uniref:hypothetical protein n=1 Tax=Streptomyces phaeochromogenes TaxID=1923 RepID=UPI00324BCEFB